MRTISYHALLDKLAARYGVQRAELAEDQLLTFQEYLDQALCKCWQTWWWPELMQTELRYYRARWAAGTYQSGDEVYHAGTDQYWQALATTTEEPSTLSSDWTELNISETAWFRYIGWDQVDETPLDDVEGLYLTNPQLSDQTQSYVAEETPEGIRVPDVFGNFAWVRFRLRVPTLLASDYSSSAVYTADNQVLFTDGQIYTCLSSTSAGESPDTTPAKWQVVTIPYIFRTAMVEFAYSRILEADNETTTAAIHDARGERRLDEEIAKIAVKKRQGRRTSYRTRPAPQHLSY
ncbi:MAG: hypothetical protein AAFX93_19900 [Verrucomicrobiota bacterium]